ncbi:dnaJ homolog subfamily C member 30, mitochondrial [Phlebotomus argentipes]|uniref:dnaJ homolog subfamily C member 30, mitochondrial n=1 Tax=Phlebotomus argentipes TaxID=94469 RepID=UPI0028929A2E|nr:dnaJ homolog subfamily C member 30, mitochondrial [Phlebotomus argentipes]
MFRLCLNLSSTKCCIPSRCFSRTRILFQAKNHYDVLGLTPKATQNDIKAAYYKLSKQYHPDKNKGSEEAVTKFRDITAAYEILGTYRLRRLYDKGVLQTSAVAPEAQESDFKSPSDVNPDDDAQTKFYKSRFKRSEVPHDQSIYNFDEWTRQHYGNSLDRHQRAKKKHNNFIKKHKAHSSYLQLEAFLLAASILFALIYFVCQDEAQNDRVLEKPRKEPKEESEK